MFWIISFLILLGGVAAFVLYACCTIGSEYDRRTDDMFRRKKAEMERRAKHGDESRSGGD